MDAPVSPSSSASSEPQPRMIARPLRALRTETALSPKSQSQQSRVLGALARIASVAIRDVVKRDGHRFFVVDVRFVKRALTRPGSATSATDPSPGTTSSLMPSPSLTPTPAAPDFQIKRRFSEFVNLRHELYYHAHAGHRHHARPCAFCARVEDFVQHAPALPKLRKAVFQSDESVRRDLEAFLELVVSLASEAKNESIGETSRWCEGRAMVPLLVKQFVLGDEGESDASARSGAVAQPRPTGWAYATAWAA